MTAAMKGGKAGWTIRELSGPNHRTSKASVYNALRASPRDDRPDFRRRHPYRLERPARPTIDHPTSKPAGSDSPPPQTTSWSRKIQARRLPSRPPAKTGVPDTRSGCTQGVSQPARTFHRRHSPFKSPAQRIIRARSHLRSSTEPPYPCLMFVVESSPCFGSGLPI